MGKGFSEDRGSDQNDRRDRSTALSGRALDVIDERGAADSATGRYDLIHGLPGNDLFCWENTREPYRRTCLVVKRRNI